MENLKLRSGSMAKPPLGIVPQRALVGVSRVLEDGYVFYAPGNWAEQPLEDAAQAYDNGEQRHRAKCQPINGLMTPESLATLDDDSGLPHIDHQIAGLLILRSLMIRDGVLPEDPGVGNRKRKKLEEAKCTYDVETHAVQPGLHAPAVFCNTTTISDAPEIDNDDLRRMAEHIASRDYPAIVDPLATEDPDAARRAAAQKNIESLEAEARQQTEAKQQRDREVADRARVRSEGMKW